MGSPISNGISSKGTLVIQQTELTKPARINKSEPEMSENSSNLTGEPSEEEGREADRRREENIRIISF